MSNVQMMSRSVLPVSFSSLTVPSFSPSWNPCRSAATMVPRLVVKYATPRMISGELAMPWNGQSLARPAASFSNVACHMNSPVSSRNAITTPRSPPCLGSRIASLLVPTSTTPSATVGLPYDCEPSSATHLTFLPVLMSQVVGMPFSSDTMLRLGVPPHIGQSAAPTATSTPADAAHTITLHTISRRIIYWFL